MSGSSKSALHLDSAGRVPRSRLFFECLEVLLGRRLLDRVGFEIARRWTIGKHTMGGTKGPHRAGADHNTVGLVQMRGQFRIGPVGPVQATAGRAWRDPSQYRGGQRCWDTAGPPWNPPELEPCETPDLIGLEPALNRAHADA